MSKIQLNFAQFLMLLGRKIYMRGTDNVTLTVVIALTSVCYKRINVAQQKC